MDLAMPGIDGWETIRTLRRQGLSGAPVAIVSANAFDKGLENDVGIGASPTSSPSPCACEELLDWLGAQLGTAVAGRRASGRRRPPAAPAADAPLSFSREQLQALLDVVQPGLPARRAACARSRSRPNALNAPPGWRHCVCWRKPSSSTA